ncbi:hypothetical protein [Paraburkholderia fungorum]
MIENQYNRMTGCNRYTVRLASASAVLQHGWNFVKKGYQRLPDPGPA